MYNYANLINLLKVDQEKQFCKKQSKNLTLVLYNFRIVSCWGVLILFQTEILVTTTLFISLVEIVSTASQVGGQGDSARLKTASTESIVSWKMK